MSAVLAAHAGPIVKPPDRRVPPNLADYEGVRRSFTWDEAAGSIAHLPLGGVNIAHEIVTRWATGGRAAHPALQLVGLDGTASTLTFGDLEHRSNQFAEMMRRVGLGRGDHVFVALPRIAELFVAAIGIWKVGAVFCPLFTAFGPEPIRQRMQIGEAAAVVTTPTLYRRRIAPIRDELPTLRHVLCVRVNDDLPAATTDAAGLMATMNGAPIMVDTGPDDPAIIHFTSGTTGTPKGALHVHGAVIAHRATAEMALDLHEEDVFWCTADPGWVTGTTYGIIAPLALGVTLVVDENEFDAQRWYRILADHHVTVWYTAPTAIRMMMRLGTDAAREVPIPDLRFIASVGEPLSAQAVLWGLDAFGLAIHDNWWQTETGGIMVANIASQPIRPGSMGRPLPGIRTAVLAVDDQGEVIVDAAGRPIALDEPDTEGMLALHTGWPSMFRTYLGNEARYLACFVPGDGADGWYLTGDIVSCDQDGYLWFVARGDDVIKSAGHLIGPFEVESVMNEHPAVAATGVFGKPDPDGGGDRESRRRAPQRPRSERGAATRAASATPAGSSARRSPRGRSISSRRFPRPAAARSCAACSGPGSSACPKATPPPWSQPHDHCHDHRCRRSRRSGQRARPYPPDADDPPFRGTLRRALLRLQDPRVPPPLHR